MELLRVVEAEAEGGGGGPPCLLFLAHGRVHLTDAWDFWTHGLPPDKPGAKNGPDPPKDAVSQLREALGGQAPTLTIRGSVATLRFQDGGQSVAFDLHRAPLSESRGRLRDLMFGLAERVLALEKRPEGVSAAVAPSPVSSPKKAPIRTQGPFWAPGTSPLKRKAGAGQVSSSSSSPAKKRLPGESLINPGFKSKTTPTGVDFEDP